MLDYNNALGDHDDEDDDDNDYEVDKIILKNKKHASFTTKSRIITLVLDQGFPKKKLLYIFFSQKNLL